MENDKIIQELILQALTEHPEGLTTKQIQKYVKKSLKKMLKIKKILDKEIKL